MAYNAGFEKGIMSKLAQWCPEYTEQLQSIMNRLGINWIFSENTTQIIDSKAQIALKKYCL
jgi:hypothetical protein